MNRIVNDTPLSDLIEQQHAEPRPETYYSFLQCFAGSRLGVMARGAPPDAEGDWKSTPDRPLSLGNIEHAGGPVILVFADREAFVRRFGKRFNAHMSGEDLLDVVLANPDCHGILVNSAKAEVSIVIDREVARLFRKDNPRRTR